MAPAALAVWFSRRRAEARTRDDDTELRIESDEELVRILTVHGAKGLEFPRRLPAWDARAPSLSRDGHAVYHEGEAEGYREVLDLEPAETARAATRREELSEDLRLLYVALTRAKYRCVVTWGRVRFAEHAPPRLASPPGGGVAPDSALPPPGGLGDGAREVADDDVDRALGAAEAHFLGLGDAELHEEVRALAAPRPEAVSVSVPAPDGHAPPTVLAAPPFAPLAARRLDRPLPRTRQLTSFTALSAAAGPAGWYAAPPDVDRPRPRPARGRRTGGGEKRSTPPRRSPGGPRSRSRAGPRPGAACTASSNGSTRRPARLRTSTASAAKRSPSSDSPASGGTWLVPWWSVRGRCASRRRTGRGRRRAPGRGIRGAGFASPIPSPASSSSTSPFPSPSSIAPGSPPPSGRAAIRTHSRPPRAAFRTSRPRPPIDGYLRGFIDLVVEHRGRWYVIDYKSNWLGPSPGDYARDAVAAAMRSSAYPLQYLLYLVALHRYLGLRLPGYDYARHVGGAFYLFVRGMAPAAGMGRGVWFDRPEASLVHGLDRLLRGGEA